MPKKKIIITFITMSVILTLSYILIKLFYPTYINYRFHNLFNDKDKEILALYTTKEISDYLSIVKLTNSNIAKDFLDNKINKFYNDYPFLLWWKKILLWFRKIKEKNLTSREIYNFSKKIVNKYKILKQTKNMKIYWWFPLFKLKKKDFCILKDLNKWYLVKNKIWDSNVFKTLATLSTYNNLFWRFLWKKDICFKYISDNSFIIYLKTN